MHTPLYTGNNHVTPFVSMRSCTLLTPLYVDMSIFDILFITAYVLHIQPACWQVLTVTH